MGIRRVICTVLLALASLATAGNLSAQETRKAVNKVNPSYPDIARRMALSGTVKIEVTVGVDGEIKHTTVIGGHPVLVGASLDALRKWKYEPAKTESTITVQFDFHP